MWQGKLSMPGYSSRSPVWMLKQAPCHGQRTVCPVITPEHTPKHTRTITETVEHVKKAAFLCILLFLLDKELSIESK